MTIEIEEITMIAGGGLKRSLYGRLLSSSFSSFSRLDTFIECYHVDFTYSCLSVTLININTLNAAKNHLILRPCPPLPFFS